MAIDFVNEIWQELKRHISTADRAEAVDSMINILIDNDHSPEQIRDAFKSDADVKRALTSYLADAEEDELDEESESESEYEYEDDDYDN